MTEAAAQRAQAVQALSGVILEGRTTDQVMAGTPASALVQELVLGCLRRYFSLERTVDAALYRPVKRKDQDLKLLMIVGAYQLRHMRVPDHAAIHETVEACNVLGKPWARGLVNAVLRKVTRPENQKPGESERSFDHPPWLAQALRREYSDAEAIMTANNERAPMALRINVRRIAAADYVRRLEAEGITSRPPGAGDPLLGPEVRILEEARPMDSLPGYQEGLVSVQDAGAQYAAPLLAPEPGARVLDACAAPGGKLFGLLERYPHHAVTALERHGGRLARLVAEAERLGHEGFHALQADATELDWWDGHRFTRVLLDAPCSGTGTLRRHPDIKVLRGPEDVEALVDLELGLLANLWRVLEPGGTLLYCTCSILAAENDAVISRFLARHPEAALRPPALRTGRATHHGWQLLPTDPDTDGFYYARMIKSAE